MVEERLREMINNLADMNWPTIGYQPIDEFNTEGLAGMWYPDFFKMESVIQQLLSDKGMLHWQMQETFH